MKRIIIAIAILLLLSVASASAGCREVKITGPVEDVSCFLGNCRGWIHSGNGYNAKYLRVSGRRLQEGQMVSKTLYVCGG